VKGKLVPALGEIELKDITTEVLQSYVANLPESRLSAKYVRNIISTMSAMWDVQVATPEHVVQNKQLVPR
jgi:hypothetical protein